MDSIKPEQYINEDGRFEATHYFKDLHKKRLSEMDVEEARKAIDSTETVTLFHGTTTAYLNDILAQGLLPRGETNIDNWGGRMSSVENIVYMTNKWHYFYAYQATDAYLQEKYEREGKEQKRWWESFESYPCYIECHIPKALLVADEDFFHSKYVSQKIQKAVKAGQSELIIDWNECLAQYGTAGVLGGVLPQYIKSFSILGEPELYMELMLTNSSYNKDAVSWGTGKGKGKVKLIDIQKREDKSLKNGCWFMKDLPKGKRIMQIGRNPKTDTIAISFGN